MSDEVVTSIRLPREILNRFEELIPAMQVDSETALVFGKVSRSVVIRMALLRGLKALEGDFGIEKP